MLELDEIYSDTWNRRNINLGQQTYLEYLESGHWKDVKLKANKRSNYSKCEFCSSNKVELHHTSYKWINTSNELRTIIALCREHHQEIHDLAKRDRLSIRLATNKMRREYKPDWAKKNIQT